METPQQARFADPGLADNQRHLSFTVQHAFPTIHQRAQFILAPDEWRKSSRRRDRFESSANSARLDNAIKLGRPFDALERLRAAVFDHEQPRDQPMHRVGDHHGARLRSPLHACRDIRRVAEYVGLLADARTNHHRARIDANSRRELLTPRLFAELRDRVEDCEAGARSALRVIVVRLGPTEIGHYAVAEILRDVAAEARYRLGSSAMIPRDRLAPFLGIELSGKRGRADQVAEEHRQMSPLARKFFARFRSCWNERTVEWRGAL